MSYSDSGKYVRRWAYMDLASSPSAIIRISAVKVTNFGHNFSPDTTTLPPWLFGLAAVHVVNPLERKRAPLAMSRVREL